jgi:hypothetical protein
MDVGRNQAQLHAQATRATRNLSLPKKLEAMKAIYEASPLVRSASILPGDEGLVIDWIGVGPEYLTIHDARPTLPAPSTSDAEHEKLIAQFRSVVSRGGCIAFGDDYFTIGGSPSATARTRSALADIQRGVVPSSQSCEGTILSHPRVRASILAANGIDPEEQR